LQVFPQQLLVENPDQAQMKTCFGMIFCFSYQAPLLKTTFATDKHEMLELQSTSALKVSDEGLETL
jgi:hypothetical protein